MPIRHLPISHGDVGGRLLPQPTHRSRRRSDGQDLCRNLCLVEKHPLKVLVMSKLWKDGLERDQLGKAALAFEACSPYACHAAFGRSDVSVDAARAASRGRARAERHRFRCGRRVSRKRSSRTGKPGTKGFSRIVMAGMLPAMWVPVEWGGARTYRGSFGRTSGPMPLDTSANRSRSGARIHITQTARGDGRTPPVPGK